MDGSAPGRVSAEWPKSLSKGKNWLDGRREGLVADLTKTINTHCAEIERGGIGNQMKVPSDCLGQCVVRQSNAVTMGL